MNALHTLTRETLVRRGFSIVGYAIAPQLIFGDATVTTVTVHADGPVDRTAVVRSADGYTRFESIDGRWHDSVGIALTAADDSTLDGAVDTVTGHADWIDGPR